MPKPSRNGEVMQQNTVLDDSLSTRRAAMRSLLWRIHVWAALLSSPFVLVAALTGILYVFTPQIEALRHGALDRVSNTGTLRPLDEAVAAATSALPGWRLRFVLPAYAPGQTVRVALEEQGMAGEGHEGHNMAARGRPTTV
jgi:uncharacterized iron-regulated membrane protein